MEGKYIKNVCKEDKIVTASFITNRFKAIHIIKLMKRLIALWRIYARIDLSWFLRDTKYCLLNISADVVANVSAIFGIFLLSERFGGIGGMNNIQILFMLGYATITDGIFNLFFSMCNVGHISRIIGRGQLDHMIIQPVPIWMQLATVGFIPISGCSTLLCGIGITIYSVVILNIQITCLWLTMLVVSLFSSTILIVAVSYITGSAAFYSPVAAEEISTTAINLFDSIKSYPLGSLSQTSKIIFSTIIPVGLSAWFPANVLLGFTPEGFPAMLTIIAAVILSTLASIFFKKGMRYYAKFGSTRYLHRGHRC